MNELHGGCAFADAGGNPLYGSMPHVARSEYSGRAVALPRRKLSFLFLGLCPNRGRSPVIQRQP